MTPPRADSTMNHHDHRVILEKMAESDRHQEQILHELREMRSDMKEIVMQTKEEARKDREGFRDDVAQLHSRINEVSQIARETKVRLDGMSKAIWIVGGASITSVVYALFELLSK